MPCTNHLIVAPLWVAFGANLGTLLRSCDAVGACMAVPDTAHYHQALKRGDTLPALTLRALGGLQARLDRSAAAQWRADNRVDLDEDSISLRHVHQATVRSVILLGHEHSGLPSEVWPFLDRVVEIPMMGVGHSLNVAVAGSLVLYKLAGLS